MSNLDKIFKLSENGTTVATEARAGLVTFLTMSYIIFVQPIILATSPDTGTGLSWHTVFVATCVSAAIATLLMAFFANYPIALAAAMGHNVLFAKFCRDGTINWQTGLGAIFISGTIFVILSLWGIREKIVNAIPASLKHAIAVGIGLLIAFIGFQWAGLTIGDPAVLVKMGNVRLAPVLLAIGGLLFTAALIALRLRGAILIGIVATAAAGIPLGITSTDAVKDKGIVAVPKRVPMKTLAVMPIYVEKGVEADKDAIVAALAAAAAEHYEKGKFLTPAEVKETFEGTDVAIEPGELSAPAREHLACGLAILARIEKGKAGAALRIRAVDAESGNVWRDYTPLPLPASPERLRRHANDVILGLPGHDGLLKFDVLGALKLGLLHVIFIFFFLDLFDTIGTLIGVSQQAGFLRDGKLPRARGALLADAVGTIVGAGLGTSTVTSYIESSAGVADGARTGLANVVTALLFFAALFFSPVVEMIGGAHVVVDQGKTLFLHPAVAPVLIIIGSIMLRNVVHIQWTDATEALPAFLAIMVMPLTFSITDGIAFGLISYSFLKLVTGRGREVHWLVYAFSILFIVRYIYVGT
ncbi:MAG: NCS2 family permease [Planctomycetota bacterium]